MVLLIEDKKAVVAEMSEVANRAVGAVAAEYRGLTTNDMNELRKRSREAGVYVKVVRNTLLKRAVENTNFSCLAESLTGPLFLAFSEEAPGAAARLLKDFAKDHNKLVVKALVVGNTLLGADRLEAIANLPTREEALSRLLAVMKAPITKLARTLAEPQAKLVRTLAAIREQKAA